MSNSFATDTSLNAYDTGIWEYVFEMEQTKFLSYIEKRTNRLKSIQGKDLFSLPESEAVKINSQIKFQEEEIQIIYGFYKMTSEMKKCYLDSLQKIHSSYSNQNQKLEIENFNLRKRNAELVNDLTFQVENSSFLLELAHQLCNKYITYKNQANGGK